MQIKYASVLLAFSFCVFQSTAEDCERPNDLHEKEEICWKSEVEIVDRIQQTSKNVLNFAKKKLGIDVKDENGPQKCEYYACIFQQMKMFNSNGFPVYDTIANWIRDYVIFHQAESLLSQLTICNDALSNSTMSSTFFDGQLDAEEVAESKPQSKCEIAAEFMKCLSHQTGCPIFRYP